jgi:hypothetical protein
MFFVTVDAEISSATRVRYILARSNLLNEDVSSLSEENVVIIF